MRFKRLLLPAYRFFLRLEEAALGNLYYFFRVRKPIGHIAVQSLDKILFVAHPDDEIIFFGSCLLREPGWLVVCVTGGRNRTRAREFAGAMREVNAAWVMWNFSDGMDITWNRRKLVSKISKVLETGTLWKKVVTHNAEGEYGHWQHKQLHRAVADAYRGGSLWISVESAGLAEVENLLPMDLQQSKREIIRRFYPSQEFVLTEYQEYFAYEKQVAGGVL